MENHNGWKRTFLVINKRVGPEFIIEQLEREGSWGKYDLVRPTGPVPGDADKYLQFQHLRKTQGFPPELQELGKLVGQKAFNKGKVSEEGWPGKIHQGASRYFYTGVHSWTLYRICDTTN